MVNNQRTLGGSVKDQRSTKVTFLWLTVPNSDYYLSGWIAPVIICIILNPKQSETIKEKYIRVHTYILYSTRKTVAMSRSPLMAARGGYGRKIAFNIYVKTLNYKYQRP